MDFAVARILDANLNRAREALRVLEEYARFGLNDATLAGEFKNLRHALAAAVQAANFAGVIVARDTPGDVGTTLPGAGEYQRSGAADVVIAAGKRLSESLRVLEEYGKIQSQAFARGVEQLRYRAYAAEQRLVQTVRAAARFADVRLYVLITASLCPRRWPETLRAAADGGATCFQLREPQLGGAELFRRAEEFVALCRSVGAIAIINDRPDVAVAAGADGVHVGQGDLPVRAARAVLGPDRIVGISTHNSAELDAAIAAQPDYIAVGPMFATALKPQYGVSGPDFARAARQRTALPLVAIGGITPENAESVVQAGIDGLAVCQAVIASPDPRETAGRFVRAFESRA